MTYAATTLVCIYQPANIKDSSGTWVKISGLVTGSDFTPWNICSTVQETVAGVVTQ